MSVKANILRDAYGDIIIQMQGDLAFEHSIPLRKQLSDLIDNNPQSKITVDFAGIDFVGSSGICHFIETLSLINKDKADHAKIKVSNISSDFQKVLRLFSKEEAEFLFDHMDLDNDETDNLNTRFGNRKNTYQN